MSGISKVCTFVTGSLLGLPSRIRTGALVAVLVGLSGCASNHHALIINGLTPQTVQSFVKSPPIPSVVARSRQNTQTQAVTQPLALTPPLQGKSLSGGQPISSPAQPPAASALPARGAALKQAPSSRPHVSSSPRPSLAPGTWQWPAQGKVIDNFGQGDKGIEIEGKEGEPVHAAAAGKVVYSGSGLRGYGKMIIVKHQDHYLSAYAFNSKLLVKEGETVKKGQAIALMGQQPDKNIPELHFEIRKSGTPVDPMQFLPIAGP
ncbi:MAG: peptidoglycan DD-metalloendopeptidase family protein [Proteobacteria bacterium]|nr:peptidoglycan DD-metalloendopeptidase family protein [Pseudomonadota bacterium]MDE3207982.1 peptidoglycan DD-metalloendopeptidase family protein [Pseudomonadota bacterium]